VDSKVWARDESNFHGAHMFACFALFPQCPNSDMFTLSNCSWMFQFPKGGLVSKFHLRVHSAIFLSGIHDLFTSQVCHVNFLSFLWFSVGDVVWKLLSRMDGNFALVWTFMLVAGTARPLLSIHGALHESISIDRSSSLAKPCSFAIQYQLPEYD